MPDMFDSIELRTRFQSAQITNILLGELYAFSHAASDSDKKIAIDLFGVGQDGTINSLSVEQSIPRERGVAKYLKTVAAFLESKDPIMRGFTAIWLGAIGNKAAAQDMLRLLNSEDLPMLPHIPEGYDRKRAAIGLGLLDVKECAGQLARYLRARSVEIQAGAALGLGFLQADTYAPAVAELLSSHQDTVVIAAIQSLANMRAQRESVEIVKLLHSPDSRDPLVWQSALYALAELKAINCSKEIARLLVDELRKGDAAKALALMDAHEYVHAIAGILKDRDALNRVTKMMLLCI